MGNTYRLNAGDYEVHIYLRPVFFDKEQRNEHSYLTN